MQAEKIPFSINKMKDAIRYETRDGREVTQVTVFDVKSTCPIAAVIDGKVGVFTAEGTRSLTSECLGDIFIITEKPIEYPCLCWVSNNYKIPDSGSSHRMTPMRNKNFELISGEHWNYSVPLTDDELKEFGLMRVINARTNTARN